AEPTAALDHLRHPVDGDHALQVRALLRRRAATGVAAVTAALAAVASGTGLAGAATTLWTCHQTTFLRTRARPGGRRRRAPRPAPRTCCHPGRTPPWRCRRPGPARPPGRPPSWRSRSWCRRCRGWTGPCWTPRPACGPWCRRPPARRCGAGCGSRRASAAAVYRARACAAGGAAARVPRPAGRRPRGPPCGASPAWRSLLPCLPGLATDDLVGVLDPLALVGLRWPDLADVGGHLAHQLLVDPRDVEQRRAFHREGDPLRRGDRHRV